MSNPLWLLVFVAFLAGIALGLRLDRPDPSPFPAVSGFVPMSGPASPSSRLVPVPSVADDDESIEIDWPEELSVPVVSTTREPIASPARSSPRSPVTALQLYTEFQQALRSRNLRKAKHLKQRLLDDYRYNGYTQIATAEWLNYRGDPDLALRTLIDHQPMERDQPILEVIEDRLDDWLPAYLGDLAKHKDHRRRLAFLRYLTVKWPTVMRYQWELAQLLFQLDKLDDALLVLGALIYDPVWGERATALQRKAEERLAVLAQYELRFPIERRGKSNIATVRLNGATNARLIVDTGAELTLLTPQAAARAGLDTDNPISKVKLHTASGVVTAPVVRCGIALVGGSHKDGGNGYAADTGKEYRVAVYQSPLRGGIDGLLGMDVLEQYHFFIDQEQQLLLLQPRF